VVEPPVVLSRGRGGPSALHVWRTTESSYFEQQADVTVAADGTVTLDLLPGAMYTVTTTQG